MKSALHAYKSHQKQRLFPRRMPAAGCSIFPSGSCGRLSDLMRTIPTLSHLAAARTLATITTKRTHYDVLGLPSSATANEIREAFLTLSKQCHPDVVTSRYDPDTHKKFVRVNEAYSVLSKPLSRQTYDATLNISQAYTGADYPHNYRYQSDREPYMHYNYKDRQSGTDWTKAKDTKDGKTFTKFVTVTSCLTCAAVALIFHYTYNYIPDPKFSGLRKTKREEVEQNELIMTSTHDGVIVYYYAVPKLNDPKNYEVLAVMENPIKDSDTRDLQELNKLEYSRQHVL